MLRRVSVRCLPSPLDHSEAAGLLFSSSPSVESNFYSSQELLLLSWLNMHYHRMRGAPWAAGGAAQTPARWIVNFDLDLADGLVLASLLASHCPYLVSVGPLCRLSTTAGWRCLLVLLELEFRIIKCCHKNQREKSSFN